MKRLVVLIAMLGLLGCAGVGVDKDEDLCSRLHRLAPSTATVTNGQAEVNQYMYYLGAELAVKMKQSETNEACVYGHMHMMHMNLTTIGEICAEKRDDGTYLIETSCDYQGGEEVKRRDHVEHKLVK